MEHFFLNVVADFFSLCNSRLSQFLWCAARRFIVLARFVVLEEFKGFTLHPDG